MNVRAAHLTTSVREQPMSEDNDETVGESENTTPDPEKQENYQVGYKKPPKHSQFKKGVPSPRKGKKRKSYYYHYNDIFWEVAREEIEVNLGGKVKKMSRIEACIRKLAQLALNGDRTILMHYIGTFAGDLEMRRRDMNEISRRINEEGLKIDTKTFKFYE